MRHPIRHISVRVPWHDKGWNGHICDDPRNNGSCMFLPRIQTKDIAFEEANRGLAFNQITDKDERGNLKLPPCVSEKVSFMADFDVFKKVKHPYAEFDKQYSHYVETTMKYPRHSFSVIPYKWMLKDKQTKESEVAQAFSIEYDSSLEPKLGFEDAWVQHGKNQKSLLDSYSSAIVKNHSLVFIYAKNIPLIDNIDRVLIGVGKVTDVGELTQYEYSTKNPEFYSFLWERPVAHSIRRGFKKGFLLPYHELIEINSVAPIEELEKYIAYCPNYEEFSFGSELVTHDSAIDALLNLRSALFNCGQLLENSYEDQLQWIDNEISNIWNMRGAFPGLGAVLAAMEVPNANLIAWEIEKEIFSRDGDKLATNPWDLVFDVFDGRAVWLRESLLHSVGKAFSIIWKKMPQVKKDYLQLISRLAINNEQAKAMYGKKAKPFLENPYLFYESTVLDIDPIPFSIVDKAVYPPQKIQDLFPLALPSLISEPLDKRRVRSLVIEGLEAAAIGGHTIQTQDQIITYINNLALDRPCKVTSDILLYAEEDFFSEADNEAIRIISGLTEEEEEYKYYKLHRLQEIKEEISSEINRRISDTRLSTDVDWLAKVLMRFSSDESATEFFIEKEERAKREKAAALHEMAQSRFTILVGPAGTGKTTLLELFCQDESINEGGVLLLAPTGKARVKLSPDAWTIAQFLSIYKRFDGMTNRYFLNNDAQNYGNARTVIIDEASMLTEEQLGAVINTLVNVERLILVGDPRQLPPIGTGKPFVDIINQLRPRNSVPEIPVVGNGYTELNEIFRQSDLSDTHSSEKLDVRLSKWFSPSEIRKGIDIFNEIENHLTKDWTSLKIINWNNVKELEERILSEMAIDMKLNNPNDQTNFDVYFGGTELRDKSILPAYFTIDSAEKVERWQILSPINSNGYGNKEINRLIQKQFHSKTIEKAINPPSLWYETFFPKRIPIPVSDDNLVYGDKVINLRNTKWDKDWHKMHNPNELKTLQYFANGEIGIITGEQRGEQYFKKHFERVRAWQNNGKRGNKPPLIDPNVNITFSSQPGYSYQIKTSSFANGNNTDKHKVRFELAYSITVHKAQGSGFETVYLILPNPCGILSRELLYTALTRHKDKLVIFHQGDFSDFKKYINDGWSEIGRRITDLFSLPSLVSINKKYYDSKYVQISANGEFMISKSEVIIADSLLYNSVKYSYEAPITERGITIHPDFTIEDKKTGKIFYWEHLGLLNDDEYRRKWQMKLEWYNLSGIVDVKLAKPTDRKILVITKDKPDGGIDAQEVKNIIVKTIKGKIN